MFSRYHHLRDPPIPLLFGTSSGHSSKLTIGKCFVISRTDVIVTCFYITESENLIGLKERAYLFPK